MSQAPARQHQPQQKIRLTAALLGLLALVFYLGFIALVFWVGQ